MTTTKTPFLDHRSSQMWMLTERANHSRIVPLNQLYRQTAAELEIPTNELPYHLDATVLDALSRYGPPRNFPAPGGVTGRPHDALGYSSPVQQARLACEHLMGEPGSQGPLPPSTPYSDSSGSRIPGRVSGKGLGQAPTESPLPSDRANSLATAPRQFLNGAAWLQYCTPPINLGEGAVLMRMGTTHARTKDTQVLGGPATVTVQGQPT